MRDQLVSEQREMALTQGRCENLLAETQRLQHDLALSRREHEEYKLRAAGILQVRVTQWSLQFALMS